MNERAVLLGSHELVGVVSDPPASTGPCVLLLNAGLVHRVGNGRLSVRLARALAADGRRVVRFDHGGIGDSLAPRRTTGPTLDWRDVFVEEALGVLDELQRAHGDERFVLVGLCAGAETAFRAALRDPRVVGLVLLNPHGLDGGDATWSTVVKNRGHARHYWQHSLRRGDSWRRALTGRIGYRRLWRVLATSAKERLLPSRRARAVGTRLAQELTTLVERDRRVLFLLSRGDHAEDYLAALRKNGAAQALDSSAVRTVTLEGTDHTFTHRATQAELLAHVTEWMRELPGPDGASA